MFPFIKPFLFRINPETAHNLAIQSLKLNSIRDNNKFEINSVEMLYSLPVNSFTLISDENDDIYLAKIINFYILVMTKN